MKWMQYEARRVKISDIPEVLAHLVVAAVFKTVEPGDKRWAGGFDSHALPLIPMRFG